MFQQFNLLGKLTALENVVTPLFYAGYKPRERRRMAINALERARARRSDVSPAE